jgi:ATP-dependent DNA helicase RecG
MSRLVVKAKDSSSFIELVWFKSVKWIASSIKIGEKYLIYGKVSIYGGKKTIAHPEMEAAPTGKPKVNKLLEPVYHSTEKLNARGLDSKLRRKIIATIFQQMEPREVEETLPTYLTDKLKLITRYEAIKNLHFPSSEAIRKEAEKRLKFSEIFFMQLRLLFNKELRKQKLLSFKFEKVGDYFNGFYKNNLQFELTNAQKRVLKEIRADLGDGTQMNRLVQGDVGSGKTIVAVMAMLLSLDNNYQACLMAPTEILAQQHYASIVETLEGLDIKVALLTGSIKGKKRKQILEDLKSGSLHIIIGTHALIEPNVEFQQLGIAIIDEQHRFGVMQRSRLWNKNEKYPPHVLVMTATPIPRTLALTLYGDLDVSMIDEMPPGRKEIKTVHFWEKDRPKVLQFMHAEIKKGRQIYIVFPLIEESAKLDLNNLMSGYETLLQYFPPPDFQISVVHGRMKATEKDFEMDRFVKKITQIMVATTVIEVGVNVPNASVMIIENTERFGLSQLHQLRGRVGRGSDQSYCILMTGQKLSKVGRERINTMVETNDGFRIAEVDLRLRGPGNIEGTQQSGILEFNLFNIITDNAMVEFSRRLAIEILDNDPLLQEEKNHILRNTLKKMLKKNKDLSRIS